MALTPELDEHLKREAASSFANAVVREISYAEASEVILKYEWLQNMGTTEFTFGLFFRHPVTKVEYLAGVTCFGSTGGSNSHASVCGKEYADRVRTLTRGACVHWADSPCMSEDGRVHTGAAASYLINRACDLMSERGFNAFIAFSDPAAGERGVVYRASNWLFCGQTSGTEEFRWTKEAIEDDEGRDWKDGKWHNSRLIHSYTRNRVNRRLLRALVHHGFAEDQGNPIRGSRSNPYLQRRTRKQQREAMLADGFEFRMGHPKMRYAHFAGNKRIVRELRKAMKWKEEEYPKCDTSSEETPVAPPLVARFDPSVSLQIS